MENLSKDIVTIAVKYFNMSEEEAVSALNKARKRANYNEEILYTILTAVEPYFERYINVTSKELQRKIGRVAFTKINYSALHDNGETSSQVWSRLKDFFKDTSNYGINPYEIFYSSVITNAHLFTNREGNFSNYKETICNFNAVSSAIEKRLGLASKKVANMYEKCSSLCYKADTLKVRNNYSTIREFFYGDDYILSVIDVKEIFRNNPSLFTCSDRQIRNAFFYLTEKAEIFKTRFEDSRKVGEILRDWIMSNSSALTINEQCMRVKEKRIYDTLSQVYPQDKVMNIINSIFENPTSICAINKISSDVFYGKTGNNYIGVIKTIAYFLDNSPNGKPKENTYNYLLNTKLLYSVDNKKLFAFLKKVKEYDEKNKTELLKSFADKGDAIYPYFEKYSDEEIIEKLRSNKITYPIKLYNMTKNMIAQKFYEIFSPYPEESFAYLDRLLHANYNHEVVCQALTEPEEYLDLLIDSTNSHDKMFYAEMLKRGINDFLGICHEYEYKYIKKGLKEEMKDFDSQVEFLVSNIDDLYNKGVDSAKKRYDNIDTLYSTFKKNTEEKLSKNNNPIFRQEQFLGKLDGVIDGIGKSFPDKQLSLYDAQSKEDEENYKTLDTLNDVKKKLLLNLGKDEKIKEKA